MGELRSYVDLEIFEGHKDHICWILSASEDVLQRRFGIHDDVDIVPSISSDNVSDNVPSTAPAQSS